MPRNYVRKSLRATCYTPSCLLSAIEAIESGKLTTYAAAKKYRIPISTLHDRSRKKTGIKSKTLGRPTAIPFEDEQKLASAFKALKKWGFGLSKKEVLDAIVEYIRLGKIKTPFINDRPGPYWFEGFQKRHSLSIKKPQSAEFLGKKNIDPILINEYIDLLDQTLTELDLRDSPSQIWNLDETSVTLNPFKTKDTCGIRFSKTSYDSVKENVTLLTCVNADGIKLTPLVVFEGKHIWDQWMAESKKEYNFKLSYAANESGLMERQIFYNYIKDIFVPSLGEDRPVLLIYNGGSSLVDVKVVELAIRNNVTILKLPPHTSHLLQPLDLAVLKSIKTSWNAKLVEWQRANVDQELQKKEFVEIFSEIWHNCFSQTIVNGFRYGGIYPFNRNVITVDKNDHTTNEKWLAHNKTPCTKATNLLERDFQILKCKMPEKQPPIIYPSVPSISSLCNQDVHSCYSGDSLPEGSRDEVPVPDCSVCTKAITGLVFVCVQCNVRVCGACDARGHHAQHYVLRAPIGSSEEELREVVARVREAVSSAGVRLEPQGDEGRSDESGEDSCSNGNLEFKTEIKLEADVEDEDPLGSVEYEDPYQVSAPGAGGTQVVPEQNEVKLEKLDSPASTGHTASHKQTRSTSPSSPPSSPAPPTDSDDSQPPFKRRHVSGDSAGLTLSHPTHTPRTQAMKPDRTISTSDPNADPGSQTVAASLSHLKKQ